MMRLDDLIGREVYTQENERLGRLEEFRVDTEGDAWVITDYVVGAAGLFERLGLGARLILGLKKPSGYLVHWAQLDISSPDAPHLTCPVAEIRRV